MLGTIANTGAILTGCVVGSTLKKGIGEKYKTVMMDSMGEAMPESQYHVLFIVSLALGGLIGTGLDLEAVFDRAVGRISGSSELSKGLSTAILLFCAGTLSILGPMQSALLGDNTFLYTNAVLDGITSTVLSSAFGFGIAIAAAVLFCWQGSIYLLASVIEPFITDALMTEISLVGGILILSSGLGILGIKQIRTLNLLPALLVPPVVIALLTAVGLG